MMLDWDVLVDRYRLVGRVTGVLHLGAHLAEEAANYAQLGVPVWWVEGNPRVLPQLEEALAPYPEQHLIHALLSEVDGAEAVFHVSNYDGMSSSVLPFGTHPTFSPDTVFVEDVALTTRTVDSLAEEHGITGVNLVVTDLQGCDLRVLRGARRLLAGVEWVMSEVNDAEVYEGCDMVWDQDAYLAEFGLWRKETHWVAPPSTGPQHWGDGLWARERP